MSLARFKAWMSISNAERTPSRPFGCWDEAIVDIRGGCKKRRGPDGRLPARGTLVQSQTQPFGEDNLTLHGSWHPSYWTKSYLAKAFLEHGFKLYTTLLGASSMILRNDARHSPRFFFSKLHWRLHKRSDAKATPRAPGLYHGVDVPPSNHIEIHIHSIWPRERVMSRSRSIHYSGLHLGLNMIRSLPPSPSSPANAVTLLFC